MFVFGGQGKKNILCLRQEQGIWVNGDIFEKIRHSLNLIYDIHTTFALFKNLNRKLPFLLRSYSHFTNLVIRKFFQNGVNRNLNFFRNK